MVPAFLIYTVSLSLLFSTSPLPTYLPHCSLTSGQDCSGNDISSHAASDAQACCNLCTQTTGCKAFTHNQYDAHGQKVGTCYLKSACSTKTSAGSCTAGIVTNTPTPVPAPKPHFPTPSPSIKCDIFCIDFEKAVPSHFSFGSNAKVVKDKGYQSNSSLHFYSKGGKAYGSGFMQYKKGLATKHFGRLFYNLETSDPAGNAYTHASFVKSDTGPEVRLVDTVRMKNGKQQYLYNFADDKFGKSSAYDYSIEIGKWVCVEWAIDSSSKTFDFWIDGTEVKDISGTVKRAIPATYPDLAFGAQVYQTNAVISGWIDDIALSTSRVGCNSTKIES